MDFYVLVTHIFQQYKFENVNVITENVCERERKSWDIGFKSFKVFLGFKFLSEHFKNNTSFKYSG